MKVRLLMNFIPCDWSVQNGPGIADASDTHFLKDEPWLEVKNTTIEECKKDNVIPWVRSGSGGVVKECERVGWKCIIGPNAVFANSTNPSLNFLELKSPAVLKLLMLDDVNIALAKQYSTNPDNIRMVRHFMRPSLYDEPFHYEYKWDTFFQIKTPVNARLVHAYQNHTAIHNGFYMFEELKMKAQHSKVCIHSCAYDNYGLSAHEISLLGCPMVYDDRGFKPSTIGKGMGIKVSHTENGPITELKEAVEKAMQMDRKKVWEASHAFQHPNVVRDIYRRAILE